MKESSSKLTTGRFLFEASLILFLYLTTGSFLVGILTSSSLKVSSCGSSPSSSLEVSPSLPASSCSPLKQPLPHHLWQMEQATDPLFPSSFSSSFSSLSFCPFSFSSSEFTSSTFSLIISSKIPFSETLRCKLLRDLAPILLLGLIGRHHLKLSLFDSFHQPKLLNNAMASFHSIKKMVKHYIRLGKDIKGCKGSFRTMESQTGS